MKPRWTVVILAALTIIFLAGSALAWDEAKLKAEVQALLDRVAGGIVKKDLPAIAATAMPRAVIKYRNGQTWTWAQWREARAKDFADMQDIASKFVVEMVWPKGRDQAGVIYNETHEFTRPSDPGHEHAIAARFRALLTKTPPGLALPGVHRVEHPAHPGRPAPQAPGPGPEAGRDCQASGVAWDEAVPLVE
jgi:hypothetical protein